MTTDLETRIGRLEDTNAIQALGILYGYVMDERDEDGIRRIFCEDATLRSQDGVFAAYGLLASHAEVTRNGVGMVVALRYKDTYRRDGGQWKFQDRLMSYMYYLPIAEYADGLGDGAGSVRAYGDHRPADWPESLQNGGKRNDWLWDFLG